VAQHEYFLASSAELASLDLAKPPAGQLPEGRAASLPGVDPVVVLLSLVEVLAIVDYDTLAAAVHDELVFDGGDDGPWVVAIDPLVVDAVRGADGDPEMEWDDAVIQWAEIVADEIGTDSGDELLAITDELRQLAGSTDETHRLYCWSN
jgi:hypothetical protein